MIFVNSLISAGVNTWIIVWRTLEGHELGDETIESIFERIG